MFEDAPNEPKDELKGVQFPVVEAAIAFALIVFIARTPPVPTTVAQIGLTAFGAVISGAVFSAAWNTIIELTISGGGRIERVVRTSVAILAMLVVSSLVLEALPAVQWIVRSTVAGVLDALS